MSNVVEGVEKAWKSVVPEADQRIYAEAGFGGDGRYGTVPVLILVDIVDAMLGPQPGKARTAADFLSCEMGWQRLPSIVTLVAAARSASVPIVFVRGDQMAKRFCGGSLKPTSGPDVAARLQALSRFPDCLQPSENDFVLDKPRSSAFFGTPLTTYLNTVRADTLIVAGAVTSGCVRATVVDGSAYNYSVFIVEDCCFDRSGFSHAVSMFEMHQKYGTAVLKEEIVRRFETLTKPTS